MNQENQTFPTAVEAVFLVIGLFVAEYVAGGLLLDLRHLSGVHPRDVSGVVVLMGNGILFSAMLAYKRMTYASLFHPSKNSVVATVGTLVVPVLFIVPGVLMAVSTAQAVLVYAFPLSHWHQAMFERMMSNGLMTVVTVCILAPVFEEMLFRGIILRSFLHQYGRWQAIVGSAILFGLAHLNIYQFVAGVMVGGIAGWLYERTRSLWPCIILHCAYNSAVTWICFAFGQGNRTDSFEPSIFLWVSAFVFTSIGGSLLRRFLSDRQPAR